MADYAITFARSARKEMESFDAHIVNRLVPKIESLAREPRPVGCRKLKVEKNLWRVRIGNYRIVYAIYDDERRVDIVAVRHRSKVYE